jgi:MobA-like NTP transferase domain
VAAISTGASRVLVVLADQPLLSAKAVQRVLATPGAMVRAAYGQVSGHPVALDASTFAAIQELDGDAGARTLARQFGVIDVPCYGLGSAADVDTPSATREPAPCGPRVRFSKPSWHRHRQALLAGRWIGLQLPAEVCVGCAPGQIARSANGIQKGRNRG